MYKIIIKLFSSVIVIHKTEMSLFFFFFWFSIHRRNIHGVSKEKIKRMLERYERCLTVRTILDSSVPDKSEAGGWSEDPCEEESQRLGSFTSFVASNKRLKI